MSRRSALLAGAVVCVAFLALSAARGEAGDGPQYADYPVSSAEIFRGRVAKPIFDTPEKRQYRTRLREGATGKADFAGHYKVITWGAGTQCQTGAVVDAKTGAVTFLPGPSCLWGKTSIPFYYKPESRLLVYGGYVGEDGPPGPNYFVFDGRTFEPVRGAAENKKPDFLAQFFGIGRTEEVLPRSEAPVPTSRELASIEPNAGPSRSVSEIIADIENDPQMGPLWQCYKDGVAMVTAEAAERAADERHYYANILLLGGPIKIAAPVVDACNKTVKGSSDELPAYAAKTERMFAATAMYLEEQFYGDCVKHEEPEWAAIRELCRQRQKAFHDRIKSL